MDETHRPSALWGLHNYIGFVQFAWENTKSKGFEHSFPIKKRCNIKCIYIVYIYMWYVMIYEIWYDTCLIISIYVRTNSLFPFPSGGIGWNQAGPCQKTSCHLSSLIRHIKGTRRDTTTNILHKQKSGNSLNKYSAAYVYSVHHCSIHPSLLQGWVAGNSSQSVRFPRQRSSEWVWALSSFLSSGFSMPISLHAVWTKQTRHVCAVPRHICWLGMFAPTILVRSLGALCFVWLNYDGGCTELFHWAPAYTEANVCMVKKPL